MRKRTSPRTDWVFLPLTIVLAIAACNFALTYRPVAAGPRPLYRLDAGRQPSIPIQYWIDGRFTAEENAAIQAAFTTWADFPGSPVSFVYCGTRTAPKRAADDGRNTVVKSPRALRDSEDGVIAQAVRTPKSETADRARPGIYSDTDIVLDYGGRFRWSTTGAAGTQDLQSVVTHEVGHILGLDDVDDPGQVMHRFSNPREGFRRALALGDQAGVIAAYPGRPAGSTRRAGTPLPR